jgi:hypothetical protein
MLEKRGVRRTRARNSEVVGLSAAFVFLLLSIVCVWFVAKVVQVEGDAVYVSLLLVPILVWAIATGRLTTLKGPGGWEASFAQEAPRALNDARREPNVALSNAIAPSMAPQMDTTPESGAPKQFAFGTSVIPEILSRLRAAVQARTAELLEVDLGEGQNWWSTRLYLVAALAEDYTEVRQIVFVADENGRPRCFVGICDPKHVRRALGNLHPSLDRVYRDAFAQSRSPDDPSDPEDEMERVVKAVALEVPDEESIQQWVTKESLEAWLSGALITHRVEWPDHPAVNDELIRTIMATTAPYVALVREGMLLQLVDRGDLAVRIATWSLKLVE